MFDTLGDYYDRYADWLDGDNDGYVDFDLRELLPELGTAVGETIDNTTAPVLSTAGQFLTLPLLVAGVVGIYLLKGK